MANSRRQFLKNTVKGLTALAGSATISGCNSSIKRTHKKGKYDGAYVVITEERNNNRLVAREIKIWDKPENPTFYVIGIDNVQEGWGQVSCTQRFDKVTLYNVPKDHEFEKYASIQKLEEIYRQVMATGN